MPLSVRSFFGNSVSSVSPERSCVVTYSKVSYAGKPYRSSTRDCLAVPKEDDNNGSLME